MRGGTSNIKISDSWDKIGTLHHEQKVMMERNLLYPLARVYMKKRFITRAPPSHSKMFNFVTKSLL